MRGYVVQTISPEDGFTYLEVLDEKTLKRRWFRIAEYYPVIEGDRFIVTGGVARWLNQATVGTWREITIGECKVWTHPRTKAKKKTEKKK